MINLYFPLYSCSDFRSLLLSILLLIVHAGLAKFDWKVVSQYSNLVAQQ